MEQTLSPQEGESLWAASDLRTVAPALRDNGLQLFGASRFLLLLMVTSLSSWSSNLPSSAPFCRTETLHLLSRDGGPVSTLRAESRGPQATGAEIVRAGST